MTCQELIEILNATPLRSLDPKTRAAIGTHASSCAACAEAWRGEQAAAASVPAMPAGLLERVIERCEAIEPQRSVGGVHARSLVIGGLALAGAVAAAALVAQLIGAPPDLGDEGGAAVVSDEAQPPLDTASSEPGGAADGAATATADPRAPLATDDDIRLADAPLDRYSVVLVPVRNSGASEEVAEAAAQLHDKLAQQLREQGYTVYQGDAPRSYAMAGMEDVQIARLFGAATVIVVTANSANDRFASMVSYEFVDARTEVQIAGGGMVPRAVENFGNTENIRLPLFFTNIVAAIGTHFEQSPDVAPSLEQRIAESSAIVLDAARPDAERVEALALLGGAQGGVRDDAAIAAALDIAARAEDSDLRGRVWQQLRGSGHPALVQPLVEALRNEPGEFARAQAATVLGDFSRDPAVREALAAAARNDASARVRELADLSLRTEAEITELIRARVLDANQPASERLRALVNPFGDLRFGFGPAVPVDAEIAAALLEMAATEIGPERNSAVSMLRRAPSSTVVAPLLELLERDPDATIRRAAAGALGAFVDIPAVRAALERARDNDTDRTVRGTAVSALETAQ